MALGLTLPLRKGGLGGLPTAAADPAGQRSASDGLQSLSRYGQNRGGCASSKIARLQKQVSFALHIAVRLQDRERTSKTALFSANGGIALPIMGLLD